MTVPALVARARAAAAELGFERSCRDDDGRLLHVLAGDWRVALSPHAPFDLVFVDGGGAKG